MPEESRPPVAIRITRPYSTEEEFLEQELETLSRTSVTLLGAQPRPQGVVLRFELVLASGHVLMRGEGRVVGFRPNAYQGLGGLALRFTRLDSRSKGLVDRAAALRERRRPSTLPGGPIPAAPPSEPEPLSLNPSSQPVDSAPTPSLDLEATHAEAPISKHSERPPPPLPSPVPPPSPAAPTPAAASTAPPLRDELLERLRTRAKALPPTAVQQILEQRNRQA